MTCYKAEYYRAKERAESREGRYYKTLRQSNVEPVFGTLINYMVMRKINTRGIESANKVMLMAAMAYNLKKLMKYQGRNGIAAALLKTLERHIHQITTFPGLFYHKIIRYLFNPRLDINLVIVPV